MLWTAPTEKNLANDTLERKLRDAANQLWAGVGLKQSDYSEPILGLIFLRFAELLTGLDTELAAWEQRREKPRALKQAMMQELLTGRTRPI